MVSVRAYEEEQDRAKENVPATFYYKKTSKGQQTLFKVC